MNARVFLLIVFSGFFMAVWNSDEQAMQASLARRNQQSQSPTNVSRLEIITEAELQIAVHGSQIDLLEWEAFVNDYVEQSLAPTTAAIVPQIEITPADLSLAESGVITLQTEQYLADQNLNRSTEVVLETWINFESPEDLTVYSDPAKSAISVAIALAESATTLKDAEFNQSSTPEPLQSLASIGDEATPSDLNQTDSISPEETAVDQGASELTEEQHVPPAQDADPSGLSNDNAPLANEEQMKPLIPVEGPTIPLPVNLADGTWQVVDSDGYSIRITVDRSKSRGDAKTATATAEITEESFEEDFCIRTSPSGERWCFVRSFKDDLPAKRVATEFFSPVQTTPNRK